MLGCYLRVSFVLHYWFVLLYGWGRELLFILFCGFGLRVCTMFCFGLLSMLLLFLRVTFVLFCIWSVAFCWAGVTFF